jgi:phospholipid/cholesterol/gamma-HCH transport system substrate-binding protein
MSKRVAINLGFFLVIFATMVVWSVRNVVSIEAIDRPYELTAEFTAASGILPRAEVAYLGVHFGTVSGVERKAGGVVVTMKIDRDRHIPAGSTANVFRKSAVGEPYIDFFPPEDYEGDEGPYLEAGDNVPQELTTTPLEFSELLRSASRLVSGIDPERLDTLIGELAVAVNGRSDDLRSLATTGDQLAATFADRTELLDRFITNNTRLTAVVADHRDSFGQSLGDLALLAESLRNASDDTRMLLEEGGPFLTAAGDLVAATRGDLDCILSDLEEVIAMAGTPEHVADLRRMLDAAPAGYGAAWASRDELESGVWVRVGNIANPNNPARQYVPPIPVPARPDVAACESPLATSDGGQVAGQSAAAVPIDLAPASGDPDRGVADILLPGLLLVVAAGAVLASVTLRTDG